MIHGRYAPGFAAEPREITTVGGKLRLRRPVESDLAAVVEIHSDPATNLHNPSGPLQDVEQGRVLLESWLVDWHERGIGYWAVEADAGALAAAGAEAVGSAGLPGAPAAEAGAAEGWRTVGFSGVRHLPAGPTQVLSLYYRYAPSAWGHGWATAVAQRAIEAARQHDAALPVIARVQATDVRSRRVAVKSGLHHVGFDLQARPVLADRDLPRAVNEGLPLV